MSTPRVNLVFIGHKDHGKSTLIGRLLYDSKAILKQKLEEIRTELKQTGKTFRFAFLLDSLEEERRGGLTIDIMQTPFKSKKYLYTIIDCPGHREFIRKMLTGASQADAAVLVVSAKEGVQDQTRQHAFLAKTLGIKQLVVAVNKMDKVGYKKKPYQKTCNGLTPVLKSLGYTEMPMTPVSAMEGDNVYKKSEKMKWFKGPALIQTLDETISPIGLPLNKPLRGVVQDVYSYENNQRIIACKIETGTIKLGEKIVFNPSGEKGSLKRILAFGKAIEKAEPGDSIGLIVDGIDSVSRGEVLSYPENQPEDVESFTAEIILLSDIQIKNDSEVTIRYGTAKKKCKIQRILSEIDPVNLTINSKYPEVLTNESVGEVEFMALDPLCVEKYSDFPELGRFVIEGKKGTAAAGIILEVTHSTK